MLSPLGLSPSFGFGDRLGIATPGHIAAVKGTQFSPIFAQQSVRENARTRRTPMDVIEDARRAVEDSGWDAPWGADADHLKTVDDLADFVTAGYTFYTVDPGDHVDNAADTDSIPVLQEKSKGQDWGEFAGLYLSQTNDNGFGVFDREKLLRAMVKYGRAIHHTEEMYKRLSQMKDVFDFEVSVDETEAPTTALEHYFIANELTRRGIKFTSLAPRFIGDFEKGVDYIGNLAALDAEMAQHAAVTNYFGTYKISLHSGSDKFSVYPLLVKHWGNRLHVKTAGTSYLEGLRTLAVLEPDLFKKIYAFSLERYPIDKATYHISADVTKVPSGVSLPSLLNDFHAREIMHVTFGSVLVRFGSEIKSVLMKHSGQYQANLQKHFNKHLEALTVNL